MSFETGVKLSQSNTDNNSFFYNWDGIAYAKDNAKSFSYSYKEDIRALYFINNLKLSRYFTSQFGIRIENTSTNGYSQNTDFIKANYTNLFPTIFLNYSNKNRTLSYAFTSRISRPSFWDLNPFNYYITDKIYLTGNPFLYPSKIFKQEITYTHSSNIIAQVVFSKTKGLISTEAIKYGNSNSFFYKKDNYSDVTEAYLNITYYNNAAKWWKYDINLLLGYAYYNGDISTFILKQQTFTGKINLFNSFTLSRSKNIFSTLSCSNIFPHYSNSTFVKNQFQLNFSIRKGLTWGNIGLSFSDIFKTATDQYLSNYNNYSVIDKNYYDLRGVQLYVSVKLGKKLNKKNYNNRASNTDEQIRAK